MVVCGAKNTYIVHLEQKCSFSGADSECCEHGGHQILSRAILLCIDLNRFELLSFASGNTFLVKGLISGGVGSFLVFFAHAISMTDP